MINKAQLHDELDRLVNVDGIKVTANRGIISMVGHALIELGLLTSIECAYPDCKQSTRKFHRQPGKRGGGPLWINLDHVIEVQDGGTDLPSNLQFLHGACNGSKGSKAFHANPKRKQAMSDGLRKRWEDPDYREKVGAGIAAAFARPESIEKRSNSMKKHWSDPERKKKHVEAIQKRWDDPDARAKQSAAISAYWAKRREEKSS